MTRDDEVAGGYLIPPGGPSAKSLCEVLNREAEPGEYYVARSADLLGWTYIDRIVRPKSTRRMMPMSYQERLEQDAYYAQRRAALGLSTTED